VCIDGVRIAGVYACLPESKIDNRQFETHFGPDAVADVAKMVGVNERRWARANITSGDLTVPAAKSLMEQLDWSPESIDAIIFVSQTSDYKMPATSCILQHRLGLSTHCAAFDMSLGCSAYPYALWVSMSLLRAGGLHRALLCVSETMSKIIDPNDRATAMLFGDAATVTALEARPNAGPTHFVLGTDGSGYDKLIIANGARGEKDPLIAERKIAHPDKIYMDGWSVFNFTINAVPGLINESLRHARLATKDVDYFLLHQANAFMLDHIGKKSKLPPEKILRNISAYGNTSCASIPLLMSTEMIGLNAGRDLTLALIGFGVGYSWSSSIIQIDSGVPIGWTEV
jgi:3-oxoacyl-[acyl-carrier-protein] synthase-3